MPEYSLGFGDRKIPAGKAARELGMDRIKGFDEAHAGKPYSSRDHISENEIERWSALISKSRAVLYDLIAIFLGDCRK